MSKLEKKYIGNDQVDGDKIRLLNNQALNADLLGGSEVKVFKLDTSDKLQFIQMIHLPQIGVEPTHAVRVDQLQAALEGLNTKSPVKVATTEDLPLLSGLLTIDDITLVDGDRVLVKDQDDPSKNGIYTAGSGVWARTVDANSAQELTNAYVAVQEGTDNAGKFYVQSGLITTLSVDPVNFIFFNSSANLTGGNGITVLGGVISVDIQTGGGLVFNSEELAVDFSTASGFGLENDGGGLLQVASEIAGDGLTGGSGAALAVEPLVTGSANVAASIDVTASGVGIKIDGSTITENGSGQLEVTSVPAGALDPTVAGEGLVLNGITNAIDVNVDDDTIVIVGDVLQVGEISDNNIAVGTISGNKLDPTIFRDGLSLTGADVDVVPDNQTIEINGSSQVAVVDGGIGETQLSPQVDGQTFDATYLPNNYTPIAVGSEPTTSISAHLKGIDEEFLNFASSDTLFSTYKAVEIKNANFTLETADTGKYLIVGSNLDILIPTNTTSPVPIGAVITVWVPANTLFSESIDLGASLNGVIFSSSGSYPEDLFIQYTKIAVDDWQAEVQNSSKDSGSYYFAGRGGGAINYTPTSTDTIRGHITGIDNELGSINTAISGLVFTFADLTDTTFTGLANNEIVQYNSGTGVWENVTLTEAGIASTTHASTHVSGGSDEIDGDILDIDWDPTNYTPLVSPVEVTSLDHLTAHLAGIDAELATIPSISNAVVEEFTLTSGEITSGVVLSNLAIPASTTVLIDGSPTQFNSDLSITDDGSVTTVAFSAGLQAELNVGQLIEVKYITDVGAVGVGSVSEARQINTDLSLTGGGDLSANRTLTLLNDVLTPGNSYYYGTNSTGAKGWFLLPTEVGNAVNLDDLQDVTITTVVDGELLIYDSGLNEWINQTYTEAGFTEVSRTGDYADLINPPTVSFFTNDANYTSVGDNVSTFNNDANYRSTGDNVSLFNNDALYISETDNVSLLTNDANYISSGDPISSFTNDLGYLISGDIAPIGDLETIVGSKFLIHGVNTLTLNTSVQGAFTFDLGTTSAPLTALSTKTTGNIDLTTQGTGDIILNSNDTLSITSTSTTSITSNTLTATIGGSIGTANQILRKNAGNTSLEYVNLEGNIVTSLFSPTNYTQANNTIDGHLDGINTALNAFQASSVITEQFTLIAGDLTNGYIDLSNPAAALVDVVITGLNEQFLNSFTLTTPVTNGRVTWSAGIASQLSVGNVIEVTYIENIGIAGLATNSHATTHESGGSDEITGSNLELTYASTNYTPTDNTLGGHVEGINTALGNIVENPFELQDIVSFTGASDLLLAWANDYVRCTDANAVNVTVQPVATIAHTPKTVITIRQAAAGQVTLVAGSGVTLNVRAAEGLKTAEQHAEIQLTHVSNDVWDIRGGVA